VTTHHWAASFGSSTSVVELLLQSRAAVSLHESSGQTPLWIAYSMHHTAVVELLLQSKATCLNKAAHSGRKDAVQVLLSFAADIEK